MIANKKIKRSNSVIINITNKKASNKALKIN